MDTEVKCERGTYGHYTADCPSTCKWDSCKLYTEMSNPDSSKRIRNAVSIEKTEHRIASRVQIAPEPDFIDANREITSFSDLSDLLIYMINLDNNTAEMMLYLIKHPDASQADVARDFGVSRQRINTAILYACKKHPELVSLFSICIRRYTVLNNRYADEKPPLPYDQLDLFEDK